MKHKQKNIPIKNIPKIYPLFIKSFKLAKSNPSKVGLMILFDALFLISFFAVYKLFKYYADSLALPKTVATGIIFIVFSLIYYLVVLFAYSFFKYSILESIKSLFDEAESSFKRLGQFYSLNIIIAGIFFAIMIVINAILAGIKQSYAPFIFIFLIVPYALFLYVVLNASHSAFYQGTSIKESLKKGFKLAFTKIKVYRETILIIILFALVLWLLFLGSGYLVRLAAYNNYSLYLKWYAYFKQTTIIIFDLVMYFAILINRISFYDLAREYR